LAVLVAATGNGKALWYLARGTGLVALVLLTASVLLGVLEVSRWSSPRWPRFITAGLHKNVSLLVTAFLAVHIVTAIADSFAPIGWLDVIVPFTSRYRPIWMGLGALAVDLLIAITITSLLRQRIGYRAWRAVHWFSYACWPVALVHGLETGSDTRIGWVVGLNLACLAAVLAAVWWRLVHAWAPVATVVVAAVVSVVAPAATVGWLISGPLQPGWAARAGTPPTLLAAASGAATSSSPAATAGAGVGAQAAAGFLLPFTASLTGTIAQAGANANGEIVVTIDGTLGGGAAGILQIVLRGPSDDNGGVQLSSSSVSLGPTAQPGVYQGRVGSLNGGSLTANLTGPGGQRLTLTASLQINRATGHVTGTVRATNSGAGGGTSGSSGNSGNDN
jgi:sulfoxide reductase heme-binding subunit YedZ